MCVPQTAQSRGLKHSLLATNTVILLSGALVLALGVWSLSDRSFTERILGAGLYLTSAILLIVTGSVVCIIALLGTLGAYKEVRLLLKVHFLILLVLLSLLLSIGAVCFAFRSQLDERLRSEMQQSMRLYGNDLRVTEVWDMIQENLECCGVANQNATRGVDSWRREAYRFNTSAEGPFVPASCCRSREDDQTRRNCQGRSPRKEDTYLEGCYTKMKSIIKSHALGLGTAALIGVLFILFALAFSGTLYVLVGRRLGRHLTSTEED